MPRLAIQRVAHVLRTAPHHPRVLVRPRRARSPSG
jgi:hypothetical protein